MRTFFTAPALIGLTDSRTPTGATHPADSAHSVSPLHSTGTTGPLDSTRSSHAAPPPRVTRVLELVLTIVLCLTLGGCGYVLRGEEGSRSEDSVLGNGTKTLKIKEIDQTTLFTWLPYMVRSQLRDDINQRGLAKWVDEGPADFTITVRITSFRIRSYGQYQDRNQLFTGTIALELLLYDGRTNTEVWKSGPMYYSDNFENANEEQAIREILEMSMRRAVDRLQQKF